jgi:hypothetical protein
MTSCDVDLPLVCMATSARQGLFVFCGRTQDGVDLRSDGNRSVHEDENQSRDSECTHREVSSAETTWDHVGYYDLE